MNKLEQAARQALEALEELFHSNSTKVAVEKYNTAHNALREALAEQAEQEPVAWGYFDADGSFMDALGKQHGAYQTPLYAAPVRTKDLTDDEIAAVTGYRKSGATWPVVEEVARAVIEKYKEKNRG